MENELKNYHISTTRIFANGIVLYDTNNIVENLISTAKENLTKEFEPLDDSTYKMNCYGIWDGFDELEEKYKRKEDIDFSYYIFLERMINSYYQNNQIASVSLNKIEYILYRKKYNINKMPNDKFCELLIKCFEEKDYDKKFNNAKELYQLFISEFKDFDINDFSLKSNVE